MLQIFLVCLLALSGTQANYINQYGLRTLSSYGNGQQGLSLPKLQQPSLVSSFVTSQKPAIIAAPLTQQMDNGYGQQQQQIQQQVVESVNSGYGQQIAPQVQQHNSGYSQQVLPQVQQQNSEYGQQAQVIPQVQQQSSGYGQQIAPQVQQQSSGYGQQIAPQVQQQSSGYGQQIAPQVQQQSSGYGQQIAPQVQQPAVDSYGQQSAPMSPMALFMAQPAIQQLISTMVQQYHGNNLGAAQEIKNTCAVGFTQPIYESTEVTETYCRCPSGTYGFTCTENFANPCLDGSIEFTAADSRVPASYFVKCSWGIPYLNKCPSGTVRWSQELHACVADETPVQSPVSSSSSYGNYNQQQQQPISRQPLRSNSY